MCGYVLVKVSNFGGLFELHPGKSALLKSLPFMAPYEDCPCNVSEVFFPYKYDIEDC